MPARSHFPEEACQTATQLRRELSARNLARTQDHAHETTYGTVASVLYREDDEGNHGNFFPASYKRILANPAWAARLGKTYTASSRVAHSHERTRAELDCANSSDALLMNLFCHPRTLQSAALRNLLNISPTDKPSFGVRVRTPLRNNHEDRTEIDMQLGDLLIEAKLTESDFQTARPYLLQRYEHFEAIFDTEQLPTSRGSYRGYQLIRGILAAHHGQYRYAVLCDARRPDLREQFFSILAAVRGADLRSRIHFLTWQELAAHAPKPLQAFLQTKYGIQAA